MLTTVAAGRARLRLLAGAAPPAPVVIEITGQAVTLTDTAGTDPAGPAAVTYPRDRSNLATIVAEAAAARAAPRGAAVVVDAPGDVAGATALAALITDRLTVAGTLLAVVVDDARRRRLAAAIPATPPDAPVRKPSRRIRVLAGAVTAVAALALPAALPAPGTRKPAPSPPVATLVEGRVALTVPAGWQPRRVTGGPGSARLEVVSPADPQLRVHLTQAPAAQRSLSAVADVLRAAIDAEPAAVFVDFTPAGERAGRAAVTYRELRADHEVSWAVLLDGPVRIGVGCQHRPGDEEPIRAACDLAIRSAHTVN